MITLAEAAQLGESLTQQGKERELAELRGQWEDEIEAAARSADFRERAVAYRSVGQFHFRQKIELLRRGLDDESPAARGAALLSLEMLSRDHPGDVNGLRPLLHRIVNADSNAAVRRIAVMALRNGSPSADTITLLNGLADEDEEDGQLRAAARQVAVSLKKKAGAQKPGR